MSTETIQVRCRQRDYLVAATHRDFWTSLAQGDWEPETFDLLDDCVNAATTYVDIGSWIGPTLLYAAGRAGCSFGFEPDPVAHQILARNVALNPQLPDIRLSAWAIAANPGQSRMGSSSAPGDSMSSLLFAGQSANWPVELRTIEQVEALLPERSPLFVKIDIEGGEYQLLPALRGFIRRRQPTLYLSLHPHFFMRPWLGRGRLRQLAGECALFFNTLRAQATIREFPHLYSPAGGRLTPADLLRRSHWRYGLGLVLSFVPIPRLETRAP